MAPVESDNIRHQCSRSGGGYTVLFQTGGCDSSNHPKGERQAIYATTFLVQMISLSRSWGTYQHIGLQGQFRFEGILSLWLWYGDKEYLCRAVAKNEYSRLFRIDVTENLIILSWKSRFVATTWYIASWKIFLRLILTACWSWLLMAAMRVCTRGCGGCDIALLSSLITEVRCCRCMCTRPLIYVV